MDKVLDGIEVIIGFLQPARGYSGDLLERADPVVGGDDVQGRQDGPQYRTHGFGSVPTPAAVLWAAAR
jgi:hypothetical protein